MAQNVSLQNISKSIKFGTASTELDNISKSAYNICFVEDTNSQVCEWLQHQQKNKPETTRFIHSQCPQVCVYINDLYMI